MPDYVVRRAQALLNEHRKAVNGSTRRSSTAWPTRPTPATPARRRRGRSSPSSRRSARPSCWPTRTCRSTSSPTGVKRGRRHARPTWPPPTWSLYLVDHDDFDRDAHRRRPASRCSTAGGRSRVRRSSTCERRGRGCGRARLRRARQSIKGAAARSTVVRRPRPGVTILIYHRVGAGNGGQMDLAPERVRRSSWRWLAATPPGADPRCRGRRTGSRRRRRTRRGSRASTRSDRGWCSPSTTAPPTGSTTCCRRSNDTGCRRRSTWRRRSSTSRRRSRATAMPLTWAGVCGAGDVGRWSRSAPTPTATCCSTGSTAPEIADELDRSIELLGERAGVAAEHFAYPKALPGSPAAEAAVRERFRSAVIAGTRANLPGADPYRLHRSPIQPSDGPRLVPTQGGRRHARSRTTCASDCNRVRYRGLADMTASVAMTPAPAGAPDHHRHQPRAAAGPAAVGVRRRRATR